MFQVQARLGKIHLPEEEFTRRTLHLHWPDYGNKRPQTPTRRHPIETRALSVEGLANC